jgi:hypothetical protein
VRALGGLGGRASGTSPVDAASVQGGRPDLVRIRERKIDMIYARKGARAMRPTRRRLIAAGGSGLIIASLAAGMVQATPSSFVELDGNVLKDSGGTYDWANSGTLTTTNGTYSVSGTGGIFDGGHFNGNTTPPTAPPLTAAAAADTSIADAEFKVDPLSVDVTACGKGDPTTYTGSGSETNGGLLSSDTWGTSSVPNKDDLSNVYAAAHLDATHNEVFFGAERVINNGDSHIDFEFMQKAVTIPAGCSTGNQHFAGNRSEGDFLLSVDFTTGGTLGGTILYQWHCNADPTPTTSGPQPADGTVCNPPAHGQSVPHYQIVGSTAITIRVNSGTAPISCGGWVCRNADGTPTTTLAQNELMEGGIDLQQLGFTGCISTFLPHTRSSASFTSVLKDFEIIPFNTCVTPSITTTLSASSVATGTPVHDSATLTGATADAGGTVTYTVYTNNTCTAGAQSAGTKTVTNGIVPDSNPITFNTAGTYYWQAVYSGDSPPGRNLGPVSSACTSEILVVRNNPVPHSVPLVQIKDTFSVTGLTNDATGTVTVTRYSDATCTTTEGSAVTFPVSGNVSAGTLTGETSFVGVLSGTHFYQMSYDGDTNNNGFTSSCTEEVNVTITSLP